MGMTSIRGAVRINDQPALPGSVTIEREMIDVTSGLTTMRPDLDWTHVDAAGHWHAYTKDFMLPTLHPAESEEEHDYDDNECGSDSRWECAICGERVNPGMVAADPAMSARRVPGRAAWEVTVAGPRETPLRAVIRVFSEARAAFGVATLARIESGPQGVKATYRGLGELGEMAHRDPCAEKGCGLPAGHPGSHEMKLTGAMSWETR